MNKLSSSLLVISIAGSLCTNNLFLPSQARGGLCGGNNGMMRAYGRFKRFGGGNEMTRNFGQFRRFGGGNEMTRNFGQFRRFGGGNEEMRIAHNFGGPNTNFAGNVPWQMMRGGRYIPGDHQANWGSSNGLFNSHYNRNLNHDYQNLRGFPSS